MKKIIAMALAVLLVMGVSVNVFAYNEPLDWYGNYGYGYGNYYDGWRHDYNNRDYTTDEWFTSYEEEVDEEISFGVYPDNRITRNEVGATIGKAMSLAYEDANKTFSSRYGVPYTDFTWKQDLWEIAGGLYQKRIMNGYPDNTFRGQNNVTRAELAKILVTTLDQTGLKSYINVGFTFKDMQDHWASEYAEKCQALGLFKGYPDGNFRPDEYVTYQQFIAVMIRLTQLSEDSRYAINFDHMAYGITTSMNIDIEGYDYSGKDFDLAVVGSKTVRLSVGETANLKVKATPSDVELEKDDVEWKASKTGYLKFTNESILDDRYATVKIKALKEGSLTVSVTSAYDEDVLIKYTVIIDDEEEEDDDDDVLVTSITLNPKAVELEIGQSKAITATVKPSTATDKGLVWESHDTSVATVTQSGKITAVGVGNTTVTAEAKDGSGIVAEIEVIVNAKEEPEAPKDTTKPVVELTGADNVSIGQKVVLTCKVDEDNLASFEITETDILGLTGGASINKIKKVSDDTYEITLMGVEVSSLALCIDSGVAVDEAGNKSAQSNEVIIFVNSGEDL